MAYGTLSLTDLLANQNTVVELGEDRVYESIQIMLNAHNAMQREMLGDLAERSTDQLRRFGGTVDMLMEELDEFGTPDVQKAVPGQNVGFPLRHFGIAVGWTRKYLENASAAEFAQQFVNATDGDTRRVNYELKRAVFTPTNSSVLDRLALPALTLPVKALVNADGAALPPNPVDGSTFDGATHTHYLGTASFVAADLTALITTVIEHYGYGEPVVYFNQAQEATVRAFTGFVAYVDPRIISASTISVAQGGLDVANLYNRRIGIYGGAEIWIKPWIPANYAFAYVRGVSKPLVMRIPRRGGGDFGIAAEDESYPLRARIMERDFGIAVWNRTNGAVMRLNNGTYAAPTLTQ